MARVTKPLTNTEVERAKPKEKQYKLNDGGGLYLLVRSSGSKAWVLDYPKPLTKKRVTLTFGNYPDISLAQARKKRDECKALLAKGIDPKVHKKQLEIEKKVRQENTFKKVALKWLDWKKEDFSEGHGKDILGKFNRHIFPQLGDKPIDEVNKPKTVLEVLEPLKADGKIETIKKIITHINGVLNFAVVRGHIEVNYCINLKKEFKSKEVKHNPTIRPEELPELMVMLNRAPINKTTRRVILWQLLTMTRPKETATARYEDIDEEQGLWTIIINKGNSRGREHTVTLSKQVLALYREIKAEKKGNSPYLFPSVKNPLEHYSEETANKAMKRNGFEGRLTAHGMRSIASTYLNEKGYNSDWIEESLSHLNSDRVRMAYNRSQYIEQRREMLQDWADYVEESSRQSCFS